MNLNLLKWLFGLTCFCVAGYMTFFLFQAYFDNEDSSVISYKIFDQGNADVYPTFTICSVGYNIFKDHSDRDPVCGYPCSNTSYRMQYPSKCIPYCSNIVYSETMRGILGEDFYNQTSILFEDKVIQLLPKIREFYTITKEGSFIHNVRLGQQMPECHSTFSITYHDGHKVCYTKEVYPGQDVVLNIDVLQLNADHMVSHPKNKNDKMSIFVHQRGKLLRALRSPDGLIKTIRLKEEKKSFSYQLKLRISSVEVLTKREDAILPCNPNLQDEDNVWITNAVNVLGCTPQFLKRFVINASANGKEVTSRCTQEQYRNFDKEFNPRIKFQRIEKEYVQACTQMTSILTSKDLLIVDKDPIVNLTKNVTDMERQLNTITVRIEYAAFGFKEIRNYKAFGLLSLWSQIGGFVGIFLEYSLLQVPEIIERVINWAKRFMNPNFY